MKRRTALLMALLATIATVLAACGGEETTDGEEEPVWEASAGEPYNAGDSGASLQDAGWSPTEAEGVDVYAEDAEEVGYLETIAPDGESVDLQFLATPEQAESELQATREQEDPFDGTTIGNVLVFDSADAESAEVSEENLQALEELLR